MNKRSTTVLLLSAMLVPLFGLTASHSMEGLADLAQGFLGVHHHGHEVHYFIWQNLKGSVISVAIGAVVYLFFIRKVLMKETEEGQTVYANLWPAWADLEDAVYRPLLLKGVPVVFGVLCMAFDKIFDFFTKVTLTVSGLICNIINHILDILAKSSIVVGSFICGCLDVTTDGFLVLLRKTIYQDSGEEEHPFRQGFYHWYTLKYSAFKENTTLIGRSLSYGLILFCLGLCVTLIYLLVSAMR